MLLKIATRKSPLALWQTNHVKELLLQINPALEIQIVPLSTEGDENNSIALNDIGGKSLFVKTLQDAVLKGEADLAVHSIKDMSVMPVQGLTLAAILKREDPRDVFISKVANDLNQLARHAKVGTSSPRRTCLIRTLRPDLQVELLRGNVDTRVRKLHAGDYDAIILAAAGVKRLGLEKEITAYLDPIIFTPAMGQGAIAIECRDQNEPLLTLLHQLNHRETAQCVTAERAVNQRLSGSCFTPLGAHATIQADRLTINAMVGSVEGTSILRTHQSGDPHQAKEIGLTAAENLLHQGAEKFLK